MDGKAIEVLGVPGNLLAPDRMVDKLTIHFLRSQNGGGEVLKVMFPTSSSGRAVVVFEKSEVAASVLQQSHVLTVEGQRFPLQVRRTDRPEFDMPVKATVDVSMLNSDEVLRLLKSHGFQVTESCPGQLLIMGSFLKLRVVKAQLQELLTRDSQPHSQTQTQWINGQASRVRDHASGINDHASRVRDHASGINDHASGINDHASRVRDHASGINDHASGINDHASRVRDHASGINDHASRVRDHASGINDHASRVRDHAPGGNDLANQALSRSRSSVNGEQLLPLLQTSRLTNLLSSGSAHSLSSPQRTNPSPVHQATAPGANMTQRRKPPDEHNSDTPSSKTVSFLTEEDVLNYALCLRKKDINVILQSHNTDIDVKSVDNSGVRSVVLAGKDAEIAVAKLQGILSQLTATLRTQEIKLSSLDHDNQVKVGKRIQKYKDIYPAVLVSQVGDILRLVGPSADSYEMKQTLLGKATELPPAGRTGRQMGRNSRDRRSSSVPRLPQREDTPLDQDPVTTAASSHYFPSTYQDEPGRGRADQRPGETPTPASSRGRRGNESQSNDRNEELRQGRGAREQMTSPRQDQGSLAVPTCGPKSPLAKLQSKMPSLFNQMGMTKTEIKQKFGKKTKK